MSFIRWTRAHRPLSVLIIVCCSCSDDGGSADGGPDGGRDLGENMMLDGRPDTARDGRTDGAQVGGQFELKVPGRILRLTVVHDDMVRVHYLPASGVAHPERGWTTTTQTWPTGSLVFTDEGAYLSHHTATLEIRVAKSDAAVSFFDLSGTPISEDIPDQTGGKYVLQLRKKLVTDEHFYGLGEKTGPLDKRGLKLQMWTTDPLYPAANYTSTADPIYQAHPFVLGLRQGQAYGIYLNSTFRTHFDLGHDVSSELQLSTEGGDLDYFFVNGPQVSQVVSRYTGLVGRTPLPPLWALGYHQCRWSYYPESMVRQISGEFRQRKIPCDGFWLDIDYMDGFRCFTWDKAGFPAPWQLLSDLRAQGFKTTAIVDPGIKQDPGKYSVYDDGVAAGHFVTAADNSLYVGQVWPGAAVYPDFTRPATRAWWSGLIKSFVGTGLRGIWIDMNEPVTWYPQGFDLNTRFDGEGMPTDHREARNVYALLMARATFEGLRQADPDGRPFVLTRSGFAGIQRYSSVWTGDMLSSWDHLQMTPTMLMNMGLSGVAFAGTDVGGFSGSPGPELFTRWMQLGTLSPFFRAHVQQNTPAQEPWSFGAQVEQISREQIELRYRLLPYFYSLMWQASVTGAPALRPLLYEFQDDPGTYGLDRQLMLGPHLMAAPVVHAGRAAREIYLPQSSTWFDHHSPAVFSGGQTISVAAPLSRLPLLVRAGGIVPSTELMQYVGEKQPQTLYLDLYPLEGVGPTRFTLYQDDGKTRAFDKGVYRTVELTLQTAATGATLSSSAPSGSYLPSEKHLTLRFHGVTTAPQQVAVGGSPLTQRSSLTELDSVDGFFHDAANRVLHARLPLPAAAATVTCTYDATVKLIKPVQVQIDLALPAGTPAGPIYLASNLYGWEPDGKLMSRTGDTASVTLSLEQGMELEYKYTRGTWATVEKLGACAEQSNRLLQVTDAGGGQQAVNDSVAGWADACP